MSEGWVKGAGFFKNLKNLNQRMNKRADAIGQQRKAESIQRGYDTVSSGDVGYHQTTGGASGNIRYGDIIAPGDTGLQHGELMGAERLSTGNIDFGNKDQVMKIQQALAEQGFLGKDGKPIAIDGDFGKNTEHAYRQAINARRQNLGFGEYQYDNLLENSINSNTPDLGLNQTRPTSLSAQEFSSRFPGVNYQDEFAGDFGNYQWDTDTKQFMLPEGVLDHLDWDNQYNPTKSGLKGNY